MKDPNTNPHQRVGAISNAHVGRAFEMCAKEYFSHQGVELRSHLALQIGFGAVKKLHKFDLGCEEQRIIVECKSHRWTIGNNSPSAKLTVWSAEMLLFSLAPASYRKIMFVLRHHCDRRGYTLASHYIRNYGHLIPDDVEFFEFDEVTGRVDVLKHRLTVVRGTEQLAPHIGEHSA